MCFYFAEIHTYLLTYLPISSLCDITPSDLSTKCYWLQTETSTICMITDYMGLYGLLEFQGPYGLRLQKFWLRSHLW